MPKQDHIVYLDFKSDEFSLIAQCKKTMIIRGATGRKLPYGIVNKDDTLFFINNNGEGKIIGKSTVESVYNSEKMDKQTSEQLVKTNQEKLQLTQKQFDKWAGKRYIVLIEIKNFKKLEPFKIDKSNFGNMDDWLPVGDIRSVAN